MDALECQVPCVSANTADVDAVNERFALQCLALAANFTIHLARQLFGSCRQHCTSVVASEWKYPTDSPRYLSYCCLAPTPPCLPRQPPAPRQPPTPARPPVCHEMSVCM